MSALEEREKMEELLGIYPTFRNRVIIKSEIERGMERSRFCVSDFDEISKDEYAEIYLELDGIRRIKNEKELAEAIDKLLEKLKKKEKYLSFTRSKPCL